MPNYNKHKQKMEKIYDTKSEIKIKKIAGSFLK
jgi:hypothetical protein